MTITTLSLPDATELLHRARDLEWDLTNDFERMTREKFEFELPALFGDLSRAIKEHREEARAVSFVSRFQYECLMADRERLVELLVYIYDAWSDMWHVCEACGTRRSPYQVPEEPCTCLG